jgi:membrane protease YdiL (CAAX protease family)
MDASWLAISLIGLLCLASGVLWLRLWTRRAALVRLFSRKRSSPEVTVWGIGLVFLWLLDRVYAEVSIWMLDAQPPPFSADRVLDSMRFACLIQGTALAIFWLALTEGRLSTARSLGVIGTDIGTQVRRGVATVTVAWFPVFLALLATYPLRSEDRQHPVLRLLQEQPSIEAYGWAVLSAVILAPLFEELVFRVILQSWLTTRIGAGAGLLAASVVFAGVHGFPDSLSLFPLAIVLGAAWQLTRRYWVIVTAHAAFNGVMLVLDAILPEG